MLNFICPGINVVIENGVNSFDITGIVDTFSISRPRVEPSTPYIWSGNMTLSSPIYSSHLPHQLFLDDLNPGNPYRSFWARGNSKIIIYIKNKKVCTLRIEDYYPNEDNSEVKAEIGLTDILGILDYKTPAKDYGGMKFNPCKYVGVQEIIEKAFSDSGINQSVSHSLNLPGLSANLVPPDKPSGSWIKYAQSYLGERGFWLYVDQNEIIKVCRYSGNNLLLKKARSQVENFKREKSPQIPANKYVVTGVINRFTDCGKDYGKPKITETFAETPLGKKVLDVREKVEIKYTNNEKITITTVERAIAVIMPNLRPENSNVVLASKSTKTEHYDGQSRLDKSIEIINKLLVVALPDVFDSKDVYDFLDKNKEDTGLSTTAIAIPYDPRALVMYGGAETIEEYYSNSLVSKVNSSTFGSVEDDGVIRRKDFIHSTLFAKGTYARETDDGEIPLNKPSVFVEVQEKTIETWSDGKSGNKPIDLNSSKVLNYESPCNCTKFEYKKLSYRRDQKKVSALDRYFVTTDNKYTQDTFYWEYTPLNLKNKDENTNTTPPGWNAKEAECPTCQSSVKATAIKQPVGFSSQYEKETESSFSTLASLSEAKQYSTFLANLAHQRYSAKTINLPVPDEYILDSTPFAVVDVHDGRFVMDAPNLIYTEDDLELSFIGNYLGSIEPIPSPPQISIPTIRTLSISAQNTIVYPGSTIFITANVFYATADFTISSPNLPSGLIIDGLVIYGSLSAIANNVIQLEVEDLLGNIASTTFNLNVIDLPISTPDVYIAEYLFNRDIQGVYINELSITASDKLFVHHVEETIILDGGNLSLNWLNITLEQWENITLEQWQNILFVNQSLNWQDITFEQWSNITFTQWQDLGS